MAFSFLPHVDDLSSGLKLSLVTYIGALLATVHISAVQPTLEALQQNTSGLAVHLDVTAVKDIHDIVSLLDAGAFRVTVNLGQLNELQAIEEILFERLVLDTTGLDQDAISKAKSQMKVGAFKVISDDTPDAVKYSKEHGTEAAPVLIELKSPSRDEFVKIAATGAVPIVPVTSPEFDSQTDEGSLAAAKIVLAAASTDRADGLFTTLVTDERGIALGLVYSSELSVAKSLQTGRGVYQSRKRGLWYKGESSGDTQQLVRLALDCDKDCLGFVVRQSGKGLWLR
jgi:phosphoribosyl-ATP pyrophosphohydrolase/phosphoribosyl-AMP cyclohydrolase/histidinol dehydrogenase